MAKEILLYGDIWGYSAEQAVAQLNEARNSPEVTLRFNGDGGEVRYGWAIIGKAKELKGKKLFKNDGEANSMMAFAFCYNENNEALDTSLFKFHRASYGERYETEFATASELDELKEKNAKLRAAMEAKMDIPELTRLKGITLDQLFAMPGREEISLNAQEALQVKLINRIVPITPEYKEQVVRALASFKTEHKIAARSESPITITMDEQKLKAEFPAVYKAIFAKGKAKGVEAERDRVGSFLPFIDADQKMVVEALKEGKEMNATMTSELTIKMYAKTAVKTIEDESAAPVTTAAANSAAQATAQTVAQAAHAKAFNDALDEETRKMYPNSKKYAK